MWLNAWRAGLMIMMRFRVPGLYAAVQGLSTVRMHAELKRRGPKISDDLSGSIRDTAARRHEEGRPPFLMANLRRFAVLKAGQGKIQSGIPAAECHEIDAT